MNSSLSCALTSVYSPVWEVFDFVNSDHPMFCGVCFLHRRKFELFVANFGVSDPVISRVLPTCKNSSPNSFFVVTTFLLVDKASERTSSYRWKNQSTAINHAHPTDDVERDTGNPPKRKIPEVRGDFRIKISCWLLLLLIRFGGLELWFRVLGQIFNLQTTYQNLTWTIKTPRQKWGYGKKSRNFHESYITQWYFSHLPSVTRCPNL